MFNFEDYTKNFEKMMSQSPIKIDEAMKSIMDYNSKFGKIALDTVKKNTELSQTWAKESLSALDPFVKSTEKPEDLPQAFPPPGNRKRWWQKVFS